MKHYKIKYDKDYDEETLYLDEDHENELLKAISEIDLNRDKAIIVGGVEYAEALGIQDCDNYGKVYTELNQKIKDYLLNCKAIGAISSTIYSGYEISEFDENLLPKITDDNYDLNLSQNFDLDSYNSFYDNTTYEYMVHVTDDEWIDVSEKFVDEELSMSEEDIKLAEDMRKSILGWMEYRHNKQNYRN